MKNFILLILIILSIQRHTRAQESLLSIDSFAFNFEESYTDSKDLAAQLTKNYQTDLAKARVIYSWIVSHVRYDCKAYHNRKPIRFSARSEEELQRQKQAWEKNKIEKAAKNKKGVCEDYSQLYRSMANSVGLKAEVITGNARDFYRPYQNRPNNNHAWNAVRINGQWYLLDATWGAGHTDAAVTKFKRNISMGFFMTPPEWFVQNHFPNDSYWQLLDAPLNTRSFLDQPLVHYGQTNFKITDFSKSIQKSRLKGFDYELRLKFESSPKYFAINKQGGKAIKFKHSKEKGYDVFRFSRQGSRSITLFGGNNQRRLNWMAMYSLN